MNISLIQRFKKKKQERQLKRSALQEKWNSNRAAKGKSTVGGPMSGLKATLQAKMESSGAGDGEKKMMFQHGQNVRTPSLHPLPPHPYSALQHPHPQHRSLEHQHPLPPHPYSEHRRQHPPHPYSERRHPHPQQRGPRGSRSVVGST
jgi:hypothetical protein